MRFHISNAKYDYDVYFKTEQRTMNDNTGAANIDEQAIRDQEICNNTIRAILGDDYSAHKTIYNITIQQYNDIVTAYQNWLQGGRDYERSLTVGTTNYKHFNHQVRSFVSTGNGQYRLVCY